MRSLIAGLLVVSFLVLGACTQSRYSLSQDVAPTGDFDASQVPDAIPVWEPRSPKGNSSSYVVNGKRYHLLDQAKGYTEEGIASWYGLKFHGELTSNGEVYNMYAMSAAHKTLPLPAYLKVTNLENQKTVIVRVNDRGPFHDGRIIDLSYAAAKKLGFQKQGTARVSLEAITSEPPEGKVTGKDQIAHFIQVAALTSKEKAERLVKQIASMQSAAEVFMSPSPRGIYRVRVGPFKSLETAERVRKKLDDHEIGSPIIIQRSIAAKGS